MSKKIILAFIAFLFCFSCDANNEFLNNSGKYSHTRKVGSSANDLLSNNKFNTLIIEIQYMPGYAPDAQALEIVKKNFLSTFLKKEGGISIIQKQIAATPSPSLSWDDIRIIEKTNRSAFTEGTTMAISVIYTNGKSSINPNTLGIAYRNTSVALLGKTIHENSGAVGQISRSKLEATVLEHELAHLLGLVDLGTQMQSNHKDSLHGNHCKNEKCLMYYSSEITDILGSLKIGNIPELDADCRADLMANGGK